ncbi:MAG TPA: ABC transporter ATP-binding protein [Acidimicrobiales bacterium]|nr:ABC transporter ATP-binding protein [Acidimicrobiales bacterium]
MADLAVDIQGLSKRFRLYHQKYTSLKEKVIHAGRTPYTDLWALRDIDFEVEEGDTIGILGRNGSGKSTLLKCICGVLQPTSGQVVVRGKLAGLLELGAGFQTDLTGRQNVYLNGSLLGLTKSQVDKIFDDVVAFAELDQFIDNQVKFYSSGMYVRLGFAVAVNVDPDVLVIDEVLAVGDERFQRKCLDRVRQFQDEGRTIVFVSHSPDQVRTVCNKALVLSDGRIVGHGRPGEAIRIFREHLLEAEGILALGHGDDEPVAREVVSHPVELTDAMHPIRITSVTLSHSGDGSRPYVVTGEPLTITVHYKSAAPSSSASFVIEIHDESETTLLRTVSGDIDPNLEIPSGSGSVSFHYDSFPFLDGAYAVSAGVEHRAGGQLSDWKEAAAKVEVMNPTKSVGLVSLPVCVRVEGS